MTKVRIILIMCFLCFTACKSLKNVSKINKAPYTVIEVFDIARLKQFKNQIGVANYNYVDGSQIEASKTGNEYQIYQTTSGSPYSARYSYHLNLKLKIAAQYFCDMVYGTSYRYDETGKLIAQFDEDKRYKFSIDDLMEKLLNRYKIDLMKPKEGLMVRRYVNNKLSAEYEIRYPSISSPGKIRRLIIDANNGRTILDTVVGPRRDG